MLLDVIRSFPRHGIAYFHLTAGANNAHRFALGKIGREKYIKKYNITLMQPDGSTIVARYDEPRHFVQMPVDVTKLSDHERRLQIASRKKKVVLAEEDEYTIDFDYSKYTKSGSG